MINQKQNLNQMILRRNKKELFNITISIILFIMIGCNTESPKKIRAGNFEMEGIFLDDSIPDGIIKYYELSTGNLIGSKEFIKGVLNGKANNYYNSQIIQTINYKNGIESGFAELFDSSKGYLKRKDFYYYGRKVGPSFIFDNKGSLLSYDFTSFENKVVYSVERDSISEHYYSDPIESLETISVNEAIFNGEKRLRVFFYLIYPPKTRVDYEVVYLDKVENKIDSLLIPNAASNFYWEGYLKYPAMDQKAAIQIRRYDSLSNKNQIMLTFLESFQSSSRK